MSNEVLIGLGSIALCIGAACLVGSAILWLGAQAEDHLYRRRLKTDRRGEAS